MLPHLSYNPSPPTPLRSLPYKSHDPSFNYLTTQAGRRENLKTQQKKKRGSLRPFPSHLICFRRQNPFPVFPGSGFWCLIPIYPSGKRNENRKNSESKRSINHILMLYVLRWTDLRTLIAFPYFESRLKPRTITIKLQSSCLQWHVWRFLKHYSQRCAICWNICSIPIEEVYYAIIFILWLPKQFYWHAILRKQEGTSLLGY